MKYCPYCGAGLHEKMAFCPKCGQKFVDADDGADQFLAESADHGKHESNDNKRASDSKRTVVTRHNKRPLFVVVAVALVLTLCIGLYYFGIFGGSGVPKAVLNSRDSVVRVVSEYRDGYGLGSGFVVAKYKDASFILTNAHVVEDSPISVTILHDNEEIPATVYAVHDKKDLCLLKINYKISAKSLPLASSDAKQGMAIFAAGFPSAADSLSVNFDSNVDSVTITNGIISAVRSTMLSEVGKPVTMLQINAALNPGNSGGPLLDKTGRVVGVNTLSASDSQGIFAAVAVSEVIDFMVARNVQPVVSGFDLGQYTYVLVGISAVVVVLLVVAFLFRKRKSNQYTYSEDEISASNKSNKRRRKRRQKKSVIISIILALILILAVVVALFYYAPYYYCNKGDFKRAGSFIISPELTSTYDPNLVNYILAGMYLEEGDYEMAMSLSQPLAIASYMDAGNIYAQAREKVLQNGSGNSANSSSIGSEQKNPSATIDAELDLIYSGSPSSLDIAKENRENGVISEAEYLQIISSAYERAVVSYRKGYKDKALPYFQKLGNYERTQDYLTLIRADSADAVIALAHFEDANQIIIDKYMLDYLEGYWKMVVHDHYFQLIKNSNGSYTVSFNFPDCTGSSNDFDIIGGKLIVHDDPSGDKEIVSFRIQSVVSFEFSTASYSGMMLKQ